jgi:hypothetical protein
MRSAKADIAVAGNNLLGAAGEFAAGQGLQDEWDDQTVAKQGDLFGFGTSSG